MFFGVTSVVAQIFLDYKRYVSVLKWLTLSLFAYVAALAFAHISWGEALAGMLIPKITWSADYFTTIVAILGTTISPYLFFWQASQEAEDQRVDTKKQPLIEKHYGAQREFHRIRADTIVGMAFSNLIALSIIVTAAATLHAAGKTDIQTSAQAAEALKPIAGEFAEVIFALGIVGTGLLAIPVLAGATAYAVGEGRRWPVGLARKPKEAVAFYAVLALSAGIGIALNFTPINPISALYWSAVINGVLAVPVMVLLDVHVAPSGRDGPLCHRRSAILAGLALDRGDAAERRGDGDRIVFREILILPEHDRRHPAGHQRHEGGGEPVDKPVLARGGGDELLEADLDDLERGLGPRHQRAVGKQFDLDVIGADRHFGGQWDAGAEQRRRQERHRRGLLAVEPVFATQPHEGAAERIVRHHVGIIGPDALGQQHVVQPELLPPLHLGRGDGVERAVGKQREIGRHFEELPRSRC